MKPARTRRLAALLLAIILPAQLAGCIIFGQSYVYEEPFKRGDLFAIPNGKITRQEILHKFGPPLNVTRSPGLVEKSMPRLSDAPFEVRRFWTAFDHTAAPVLYYYESRRLGADAGGIVGPGGRVAQFMGRHPDRKGAWAWILIDEHSGLAVDYLYGKQ